MLLTIFEKHDQEHLHDFCDYSSSVIKQFFSNASKMEYIITCMQQLGCTNIRSYSLIDILIFEYYFKINVEFINIFGHIKKILSAFQRRDYKKIRITYDPRENRMYCLTNIKHDELKHSSARENKSLKNLKSILKK